ncbi:MAG TPA: ATP-binding protein [Terracidiphilus sp.]|nr:ATP-binding protein [Terracidiphilus sp.]
MKFTLQSLFLKIFFWFWATALVTGIALVVTFIFGPGRVPMRWHSTLTDTARSSGMIVLEELERGGVPAASSYIERFEHDTHLRACLFELNGNPIAGEGCETFASMRFRAANSRSSQFRVQYGLVRVALILPGSGGHDYIFATELPAGPRAAFGMDAAAAALRFVVAFSVSGFICYLLTIYLTGPVLRLREAAQQLARGRLSARAATALERRGDELGALATDFNTMADRIEELVSRQRQLIFDISHELRSPLARLNVALDLAKGGKAGDLPFDHMESDLAKLNEMIGRLLTIAKLDTAPMQVEMGSVDVTEIVERIVNDAGFEAQKRDVTVRFTAQERHPVRGNAELLHSAIENVVRNAVRYTTVGTSVEISLKLEDKSRLLLAIRDYGKGVPENDLGRIFQPFHRVAEARDRESGGVGLGLAIADRVIRIHGGTIRAENVQPSGLKVHIEIPVAEPTSLI